jgi:hypothetical protein
VIRLSRKVAVVAGKTVLGTIRYSFYVVLLLAGRVLVPIASLAAAGGLVLFLFGALFLRDRTRLWLGGAGLALAGIALQVIYQAALRLVAPKDVVIVSEV